MAPVDHGTDVSMRQATLAALLVAFAVILGGGGSPSPVAELLLQAAIAAVFIAWIWWGRGLARSDWPRGAAVLASLLALFPLLQLIPLPQWIWQALPGRDVAVEALELVGAADSWRPLSLTPHATLAGWLALVSAAACLVVSARLTARRHHVILLAIAAGGFATMLLGAFQLAGGDGAWRAYAASHGGWITGFMANRNAAADVMLIALCAVIALAAMRRRDGGARIGRGLAAGLCLLLAIGVVFTGSRTGIALLAIPAVLGIVLLRRTVAGLPILAGLASVLALLPTIAGPALGRVGERFAFTGDFRSELWRDGWFAAAQFWPVGGGIGSFVPAVVAAERLDVVDPTHPNRAHNDYLELAVEAGLPGLVLLAAAVLYLLGILVSRWRNVPHHRPVTGFIFATFAVIALHSTVDYPLRSMTLACLAAMVTGMAFGASRSPARMAEGQST